MASDADSRKRKAIMLTADEEYKIISCSLCRRQFDDGERAPRVLHCGHTFCTACLGARIRQESARKWSIACPLDQEDTPLKKNGTTSLGKNHSIVENIALIKAAGPFPFRVHIKNMAGDTWPLVVRADDTVGDLKRRIHEARAEFAVALQWLMIQRQDDEFAALEDNAATLGALGIGSERVVSVVVRDGFRGGAFVRSFGSHGSGAGQFSFPWGMCVSPDGKILFVAALYNNHVQVVRASDSSFVRTIGGAGTLSGPSCVCVSFDGAQLFIADTYHHRVQVVRTADGAHVRTIASLGLSPYGVCLSPDGEYLYVADTSIHHVQVVRAADGAHMRTIGSAGSDQGKLISPFGLCMSPDGEFLYVADHGNHRVQVFHAANGVHVRTIGAHGSGAGQFNQPYSVCVSPSGEWLFVADTYNHRVQVLRASTGEHVHTIGSKGSGTGQFNKPRGVCLSPAGDFLYVADTANNRVQIFAA